MIETCLGNLKPWSVSLGRFLLTHPRYAVRFIQVKVRSIIGDLPVCLGHLLLRNKKAVAQMVMHGISKTEVMIFMNVCFSVREMTIQLVMVLLDLLPQSVAISLRKDQDQKLKKI